MTDTTLFEGSTGKRNLCRYPTEVKYDGDSVYFSQENIDPEAPDDCVLLSIEDARAIAKAILKLPLTD